MPVSDLDIWRSANLLIKRDGDGAGLVATQRADELLAVGDAEGHAAWVRIRVAIDEWGRADRERQ